MNGLLALFVDYERKCNSVHIYYDLCDRVGATYGMSEQVRSIYGDLRVAGWQWGSVFTGFDEGPGRAGP